MKSFRCEDCGKECEMDPSGLYAYCHTCKVRWDLVGPEIQDGEPPAEIIQ